MSRLTTKMVRSVRLCEVPGGAKMTASVCGDIYFLAWAREIFQETSFRVLDFFWFAVRFIFIPTVITFGVSVMLVGIGGWICR